ncbi:hypothetical protein O6P43_013320 [Quillaja saponaria]|uniref:Uncharacterized protein n=1 Tax=Quillaja saponaria TaxID=32244 RepID=A0AAD7PVZ8_QUISA|nr:hypothetical protein O6P43_013320 [Quillaja saponaria]
MICRNCSVSAVGLSSWRARDYASTLLNRELVIEQKVVKELGIYGGLKKDIQTVLQPTHPPPEPEPQPQPNPPNPSPKPPSTFDIFGK